ncbi:ABC-type glycerol-3-phosphate transport system permease component [Caldalkalibacillus uzonensis]|uniref:ABC-type glycerol-3-phosphate transport system permease component n=1 Tax=Caldalkalibacillus uzonensis TaxID=353224 RepID=A0ABU0CUD4_9BACI|nr:carbohydrate ABC transporter permease [Caldalkalibacillus uzonensis]MDQ0340027.1 ABC-type glycerol-3-phosphate transport system permease component [Caldalkalibacillus uzonensis]
MSNKSPLQKVLIYLFALIVFIVSVFPFWWMVVSSLKPAAHIFSSTPSLWPDTMTLEHYLKIFLRANFWVYFTNSLIVAGIVTLMGTMIACLAGYALGRFNIKGKNLILLTILSVQMFPVVVLLIPLFIVLSKLNLVNTLVGLVITYLTFALPFCIWMMRSYFSSIPAEIEEAALIDGCTQMQAFRKVVLPLAWPGISATSVFAFIMAWNEFVFAVTFIQDDRLRTLPLALQQFFSRFTADYGGVMAASTIATIPVLLFFILFQRKLTKGLVQGSVNT